MALKPEFGPGKLPFRYLRIQYLYYVLYRNLPASLVRTCWYKLYEAKFVIV
jgi:hypothetical protein